MRKLLFVSVLALAPVLACSCSGGDEATDARPAVSFGSTYDTSPWPRDGFHLDTLPLDGNPDQLADLVATLDENDDAPVRTSIFFPTEGGARDSGPISGDALLVDLTDHVLLPGQLDLFYRATTNELVALMSPSLLFKPKHRYACLVQSPDVRRSSAFDDAISGRGPDADALAGARDAAPIAGLSLDRVVAATVFTVSDPTPELHAMRAQLDAMPAPVAHVDRVMTDAASLDDFFGMPTTTRSGLGDPAGIVHDAVGAVVLGTFDAPMFVSPDGQHLGRFEYDDSGNTVVKGTWAVPFMLVLPRRADYASTPVLVFQHGLSASRMQVGAVANDYARGGYATIGIDAPWHGDRAPLHKDDVHNYSGATGPDGMADEDPLGGLLLTFDFTGDADSGVHALDGRVVRDNLRQGALDISSLTRLVKQGDLGAVKAADPLLASFSFDSGPLVYTGESFGSLLGVLATAIDPNISAAVLAVPGAGIFLPVFADSPTFSGSAAVFLRSAFDHDLDLSDPVALPAEAQRSLCLFQAAIQAGDPMAYASEIGAEGKSLLLLEAFSDEAIPNQGGEFTSSAAGADAVRIDGRTQSTRYIALPEVTPPLAAANGAPAIGALLVDPATHIMYTRFHDQRLYEIGFPPAVRRATPEDIDEPIEWLHATAIAFADSVRAGAPVIDPPP